MKPIRLSYASMLLVTLAACTQSGTGGESETQVVAEKVRQRIDSTLEQFVNSGKISGVSALIFEGDREVYFGAYGYADRENKIPMDRRTIVKIYSMTKPITGTALMTLFEKGAFQLDDPVAQYLPEFGDMQVVIGVDELGNFQLQPPKRPMTIRDLTRHTAGFARGSEFPGLDSLIRTANPGNPENSLTQMAEKLGSIPLAFHPGERWAYGPSVDVQALLVERLSGLPFDEYLKKAIFDPLKMETTRYYVPEEDRNRLAAMYRRAENDTLIRIPDEDAHVFNTAKWALTPGGYGLTSTLDDYMRFARMLVNEGTLEDAEILKSTTVNLMATNHLSDTITDRMWLPSKGQVGFGIDFAVRLRPPADVGENNGVVGEFFWDGAASTLFWVDPVNDLTAVLFVQLFPFDGIGLHKQFRDAIYGTYKPLTK